MENKSKLKNTTKIAIIVWVVCVILAAASIALYAVNYNKYSAGQSFAINAAADAGINTVSDSNSKKANCDELYGYLTAKYYDLTIDEVKYDFSDFRATMSKFKDAFAASMIKEGHDKYTAYDIENWFKYSNPVSFFFGEYALHPLFIVFYVVLVITIVYTVILCKSNKKAKASEEDSDDDEE